MTPPAISTTHLYCPFFIVFSSFFLLPFPHWITGLVNCFGDNCSRSPALCPLTKFSGTDRINIATHRRHTQSKKSSSLGRNTSGQGVIGVNELIVLKKEGISRFQSVLSRTSVLRIFIFIFFCAVHEAIRPRCTAKFSYGAKADGHWLPSDHPTRIGRTRRRK